MDALANGEAPQDIYNRLLKPHNISEWEWEMQQIQGKTEGGRKMLTNEASWTPDILAKAMKDYDWAFQARYRKLDRAVDEQLALSDPKFAAYLANYKRQMNESGQVWMDGGPLPAGMVGGTSPIDYMQQQRMVFWKKVGAQTQVVINEPTMKGCDLSYYGVKPQTLNR